ncbi:hypothetical protein ESA94_06360 [Lacibacter luteus]|uniref:Uncharacterized protein n=1 Tax=Lacibacter luteus TaxID=2508719 RepID=A0A4Q1CNC3_9BACT|nr:hypothetical protein [Lacibacter luteus]RXK62617.1 hypothetical protein ESA94_06360 [Lacibacter luteus]
MTKQKKILIVGGLLLLGQLIIFSDYISPFHWGHLKVSGLACTCPDETVEGGQLYLKNITPDSLKKYNLDYSEIYVTERPSTNIDPMGVDLYIIEGRVIGKDRVSEGDPWNPKFRVDKWREVDILKDWRIKGLFFLQLVIWLILLRLAKNKNGA